MAAKPGSIAQAVEVEKISDNEFVSRYYPERMGNRGNIAYGGCALGCAANAAYQTVKPGYHAYSMTGHYLGPTLNEHKMRFKITSIRDTRSFATRLVEVGQDLEKGYRTCLLITVDFQTADPSQVLENYSIKPQTTDKTPPEELKNFMQVTQAAVDQKRLPPKFVGFMAKAFGLLDRYFASRDLEEGIAYQNMWGMAPTFPTSQDHLYITDKRTWDWKRALHPIETEGQQIGALAFHMDAALSFVPLMHSHISLVDVGACSSLDFALRIMTNDVDCTKWHLRETDTMHGSNGRTFSQGKLWDQSGNLVAHMSQQSVLRPKPPKKSNL